MKKSVSNLHSFLVMIDVCSVNGTQKISDDILYKKALLKKQGL